MAKQGTNDQLKSPIGLFLEENFKKLPKYESFFFNSASALLSINAAVCGMMANDSFRRALKVRRYFLLTSAVSIFMPCQATILYHEVFVSQPLMAGTLTCSVCALVRSASVGVATSVCGPIFLAGFTNIMALPVYLRPMENKGIMRGMMALMKPVFIKLKYFLLYEMVANVFIASRQFAVVEKVLQMKVDQTAHMS